MFDKNTVILSLKDYLDLIKENERLKERFKEINEEVENLDKDYYNLSIERIKLKKYILKEAEHSTIWRYDDLELERIIDIETIYFGLRDSKKLLELGFTTEELIDYIKERREFYENEGVRKWIKK